MTAPALEHLVCFLDQDEREEAGLVSGLARVMTAGGPVMAPGTRHVDVPHLAVTSHTLGQFDVTHLPSGTTVVRNIDTFGAALLAMAQLHAIRTKYRVDLSDADPRAIREAFREIDAFPLPFATTPAGARPSVGAWLTDVRGSVDVFLFPWETPTVLIREAIEMIAIATPIAPVQLPAEERVA